MIAMLVPKPTDPNPLVRKSVVAEHPELAVIEVHAVVVTDTAALLEGGIRIFDFPCQIADQFTVTLRNKLLMVGVLPKAMPNSRTKKPVKPLLKPIRRKPRARLLTGKQRKRSLLTTASPTRNTRSNWRRRDRLLLLMFWKSASLTRDPR